MTSIRQHHRNAAGTTRLGVLIGLVLGTIIAAFLLVDPFGLHNFDERLRGSASDQQSSAAESTTEAQLWTCGMHPNVIADEPGICPICQMDLVPLAHEASHTQDHPGAMGWTCPSHDVITEEEAGECPICGRELVPADHTGNHTDHDETLTTNAGPEVSLNPSVIQKMNVRTTTVERRNLTRRIQTVGNLDYDEKLMVSITTRYPGFVEKVFVNHVGQPVRRGDPLFEIYSPDLVQTQRELIAAVAYARRFQDASPDVRSRAEALVEATRTRLEYWEIPADRVAQIESTGEVHRTLTVFAPANGLVMQRMHGLDGMAIQPGMELMHLADLSSLWLRAEVYEHQLPWIDIGSKADVTFDYLPGQAFSGLVRYIEPEV